MECFVMKLKVNLGVDTPTAGEAAAGPVFHYCRVLCS